ncbi:MAG: ImmA/IrrE family metallo-endopeptidase [Actinobacteria bacterium]|nr:ImmA/IrrE family metallo-endopeptidase [Actinomycetota bacterium]
MSVRVEVRPNVLAWARARSGITEDDWDRRFPKFEAWLAGEAAPTLKQLEDFARKTHTPVGFLFLEEPPVETVPIPDLRTVGDRPVGADEVVSADLLDVIYACERRQEWYRDNQILEGEPPLAFVGAASTNHAVDDVAAQMRVVLDWTAQNRAACRGSDGALAWLRERAEAAGVLVMISGIVASNTHRTLDPHEFRGFALADPYAALVFVNGADAKSAQVFTLVHELAHLWLGETALSDLDPRSVRANDVERWCNQVAAELLVPMGEFRNRLDPSGDLRAQLHPIAEHFRVSPRVVLGRLREAGALTWEQYLVELDVERERVAEFLAARSGGGGSYYNTKPVQVSRRFASALIASAKEGRTPYTRAFRLLDVQRASTFDGLADRLGLV